MFVATVCKTYNNYFKHYFLNHFFASSKIVNIFTRYLLVSSFFTKKQLIVALCFLTITLFSINLKYLLEFVSITIIVVRAFQLSDTRNSSLG